MTDVAAPDVRDVGLRGRLQRRLRRDRRHAGRDATIGAVVAAAAVLGGQLVAQMETPPAVADGPDPDDDAVFSAAMVGDVMFGRHVERAIAQHGHDALLPDVQPWLEGDYVSANLEQVISDDDDLPEADKLIPLSSGSEAAATLADAGFTTVSLANNHAMDHGIPGLRDTIEALDDVGIAHAGAGVDLDEAVRTDYQEHGDLTVATLSFTDVFVEGFIARSFQGGVLQADPATFGPLLQQADQQADLVIAHFHWGEEYDLSPNADQRELAAFAADAGADIVVGHHPHVLMPVERIGDTVVFYSLGNFVFDQGWSRTRESAIARYHLDADGTARVELLPVYLREGSPQRLDGPMDTYRRERIFLRLRGDGLDWERDGVSLVAELDHGHVLEGAQP